EGEVPVAGLMELVSLYHPRHS
ncbi:phosphohistidine phosphatase SixA, partial [Pseudomonas frederiksbergensis]|nr:phosphohistidine phosphatase SixA [Pseudomonas frederiksbergensis]